MELRSHWGMLAKRWVYAVGITGVGVGMAFLCQYYWQIDWYVIASIVGGLVLMGMIYNTLCTLHTKVRHTAQQDGIEIVDGAFGTQRHCLLYSRLISYTMRPSRLDERLGCRQVVLQAYVGASDKEEITLCLSIQNAKTLLDDITQNVQNPPLRARENQYKEKL